MGSPRIRIGLFGSALGLGVALLLLGFHPRLAPLRRAMLALEARAHQAASPPPAGPAKPAAAEPRGERSRLADGLNAPAGNVHSDLRLVNEIFNAYRGATHSENPVGENSEITAVLTGRNRLGYPFVPADHPAINSRGELCDRWGDAYFFHQLSGQRMEIRSAGPDHRLWTADDEVLTP
jgi:hypothetical protein